MPAAASRPGGPKGGGAPGELPPHQTGLRAGAQPSRRQDRTGPHSLSSSLRRSSLLPALPAPSPFFSRNTSLNFRPRPLPMLQERGQTCSPPAALDPPPRLPAMAAWLGLRQPQIRGHRRPASPRLRAVPSRGGGREGGLQTPRSSSAACAGSAAAAHSPAELALSRAAPVLSQPAGRARRPPGRRSASSGRGSGSGRSPFPEQAFRGSGSGGCCCPPASSSSPFFSFSRLKKVHLPRGSSSQD